jgi:hypothetical protein
MGKTEKKNGKKNTKVTKIPKNQKTKIWDERNIINERDLFLFS